MNGMMSSALAGIVRREGARENKPKDHFRISSIGHCVRKQIAMRAGIPPAFEPTDREILKMWLGTVLHSAIQSSLEVEGFFVQTWTEREVQYRSYKGHVDGLTRKLPDVAEKGAAPVSIKTCDDTAITKYPEPAENYLWQDFTYLLATKYLRFLLYRLGRKQALDKETVHYLTDEWKKKIDEHIDEMEALWKEYEKTKVLPPCKHRFGWEDKSCGYREVKAVVEKKADYNPFAQTETDRELSDFLDNKEKKA